MPHHNLNRTFRSPCLVFIIITTCVLGCVGAFIHSSSVQLPLPFTDRHILFLHQQVGENNDIVSSSAALDRLVRSKNNKHYHLTILLPAYNERDRIGNTLTTYMNYLSKAPVYQHQNSNNDTNTCTNRLVSGSVSMLVVDDGSSDGTAEFIRERSWLSENADNCDSMHIHNYWSVDPNVNVITLPQNSGKGAAIERGMMELPSSFGIGPYGAHRADTSVVSLVLVADADGSGDISSIDGMLRCLEEMLSNSMASNILWTDRGYSYPHPALVVGYRQSLEPKSPLRALLSQGFRSSVSLLFLGQELGVRDTQCGFKLMSVSAGKILYNQLNLRRWTQDVEVIYRARLLDMPVEECGVGWVDMDGSKLIMKKSDALFVSLAMFGEIANMRIQYAIGNWSVIP